MVNWTEVEAIANSFLVLTSASAIGYAGLQLKHERQYRSVTNLEKQLGFFQGEGFVKARRKLADLRRLMKEMDNLQLSRMDKQRADHGALWRPDRILEHYRYELEVAGYSGLGKRSAERRATRQRVEQERIEIQAAAAARMAMKTRDTSEDEDVAQRELEKMRDA